MGRPTKLTPARRRKICKALADGNTRKTSSEASGISRRTFSRWMAMGEDEKKGPHRALRDAVLQAEAEATSEAVACLRKAAHRDWRAAAWWLERRRPKEWGRWEQLRLSAGEAQPTEIVFRIGKGAVQVSPADGSTAQGSRNGSEPSATLRQQ